MMKGPFIAATLIGIVGLVFIIFPHPPCSCGDGVAATDQDLRAFESALEQYMRVGLTYPSNEQGLGALMTRPTIDPLPKRWVGLYQETQHDPWDRPYRYQFPGIQNPKKPEIISAGPDRTFGTEDDLSNQD